MGIVDVFDALTTPRPYKTALSVARALEELEIEVCRGWRDRELLQAMVRAGFDASPLLLHAAAAAPCPPPRGGDEGGAA
jgi:HD-GYP domain-containing protein (c-di-GMP phosphodiesterase class II)